MFLFFHGSTSLVGLGLLIVEVPRSHSDTPHSVGLLWTSDRPVTDLTARTTLTSDIHALDVIRTHNPSKRAAADPRLRLHGHWDRLL